MPLRSLVVDFNSYFASVEQQLRPELRGRPVAVVPVRAETTCAIAASYEAKAFGVKTGTMVREARRLCPGIVIVEARPPLYVEYHEKLKAAIESCIHIEQVWSIDEVMCELTGARRDRERAMAVAREIKQTIAEQVGAELRCSIGIAPNGFLAKTASDMQKPNGLVVIESEDLPRCLFRLELRDFCGIGRNMETRLHEQGIRTVEALCALGKNELRQAWGSIEGERMWRALQGEFVYRPPTERSSLGHSHVLSPEQRNPAEAYAVLCRMLHKAAMRLRKMNLLAGSMHIFVKFVRGGRCTDEARFLETDDTFELNHVVAMLWKRLGRTRRVPLAVGVTFSDLVEKTNVTPRLFEPPPQRRELNRLVDQLNVRYGKDAVYFGSTHTARKSAPMRIAFTRIPDLETEGD
jgi:DNA polymerase-4